MTNSIITQNRFPLLLDLFAGLGGFSIAAERIGMKTAAFAECNPFCRKVLAKHWPEVPCFEDVREVTAESLRERGVERVNIVSFGFPCQDLSVAGQRAGLSGERSGLFWEACRIVDDLRPDWLIAENVPGLRSSDEGRDMAAVVGAFAELGYVGAWRSLDAQFAGLAQRRERVFFVGGLGDAGKRAVHALLEGGRRYPAPRREAGQRVAGTFNAGANRTGGDRFPGTSVDTADSLIARSINAHPGGRYDGESETFVVAPSLRAKSNDPHRADMAAYVTHSLTAEGFDASEDGTGRGTPLVAFDTTQITSKANRSHPKAGDPCHPLAAGAHAPAIAFSCKDHGADAQDDLAPTLRAGVHSGSHENGGVPPAVFSWDEDRNGYEEIAGTIQRGGEGGRHEGIARGAMVRRLTPTECERLQGVSYRLPDGSWADGHTCLCGRNKGRSVAPEGEEPCRCPDGPRYRALGNSVAIPVVEWCLRAILAVEAEL